MKREREAAEFNIHSLAKFWAGGESAYIREQAAFEFIKRDPELVVQPPRNFLEMSREELREFTMGQIYKVAQIKKTTKNDEFTMDLIKALTTYSESFGMRLLVHDLLFRNVMNMMASEEQKKYWSPLIDDYSVIGCFAMTELGHSSALRELETTATYDPNTDEFIIDSPNITSAKIWIGMAGCTATHTVVIAQTYINGKHKGLNWFVVQLRDTNTGELMPNVIAGDVGAKVGRQGLDNGWIQFRKVRIPRSDLLSKWVKLDRDGTFHEPPNPVVMYATLIPERLTLVQGMIKMVTQALVIATRYGVVRRQGPKNQQIMDYQSHYVNIIPGIAFMYMVQASYETLDKQFEVLTGGGSMDEFAFLNHMGDLHAISGCLKSLVGWYCTDILETCRRSGGGHSYNAYNNIGQITNDFGVHTTGGGDNIVLAQQTTKILRTRLAQKLDYDDYPELQFQSSMHYVLNAKERLAKTTWDVQPNDIEACLKDFSLITDALHTVLVKRLNDLNQAVEKEGKSESDLVMDSIRIAELHAAAFLFEDNANRFGRTRPHPTIDDEKVVVILNKLTGLWGLHVLTKYSDQFYKSGYFTPEHVKAVDRLYKSVCKSLRHQVIGLTDAWGLPDFVLKAPIAKYDGDIYQAYFDTLLQAPKAIGVPDYHDKYIRPLTERVAK
ncbi:acyl-CoA dehydrogenase/oxidase [Cunninghamella echinulata]|nr:acyl-CoA dehydrogenase/oxidase [Cunninghamella echinulata]